MEKDNLIFDKTTQDPQDANIAKTINQAPGVVEDQPSENSTGTTLSETSPQDLNPDVVVEPSTQVQEGGDYVPPQNPPPSLGGSKIKKIIIGAVLLIILIIALVIFWPRGSTDESAKLVWWGLWEDKAVVAPIIEEFERENPKIKVEYVKQDPKLYGEKLQTRISNGTGPDIFRFHNTWIPMLTDLMSALPTDVITPEEFKKIYYPVMQDDLSRKGAIFGIPIGADALALFTNTEIFEAAGVKSPKTWEEFVDTARVLTVKDGGKINTAGAALGTYGNVTHSADILSLLFLQQGIDTKKFPEADEKDKAVALSFYTSFAKGEQNVWDQTLDESIVLFSRGNLAMYLGFSWDIFRMRALNPDIKFETHPVPQLVGREVGLASYWAEGVSSKSKNQKAAFLFVKHLAKKETAEMFYKEASKTREFGEIYARVDLANSLNENKLLSPFVRSLPKAKSSYFASDTNDGETGINSLLNVYLGNAVNSIINDNSSAETVTQTLDQGVVQVYEKYGVKQ